MVDLLDMPTIAFALTVINPNPDVRYAADPSPRHPVQSLSMFFTPEHHMVHVLDLVDACILGSSEQCLAIFLHPHMEDWWEDAEDTA